METNSQYIEDPKHILLVEDSPTQALMMQILLEGAGYEVTTHERAVDALDAINERLPDLVIVDFILPGMRGDEFAQRMKNNNVTRQIPILMLIAQEGDAIQIKALDSGTDSFLSKNEDQDILLMRIERMLSRSDSDEDSPRVNGQVFKRGRIRALLRRKFFQEENHRILKELKEKELEAVRARAAQEAAEAKNRLLEELERSHAELKVAKEIAEAAMQAVLIKPIKLIDLQKAVEQHCALT